MLDREELELLLEARHASRSELDTPDQLICECECVSLEDIRVFSKNRDINLEMLKEHFNLGAGCSSCVKNYDSWKTKI